MQFAPLFGHQYSHIWIDFRGIQDAYMRGRGIDYFENSRRATLSQRAYAMANPARWRGYGANVWGLTASDGPLDSTFAIDGRPRTFHTYWARGVGTDEIERRRNARADGGRRIDAVRAGDRDPGARRMRERYGDPLFGQYGFVDAFNPTLRHDGSASASRHDRRRTSLVRHRLSRHRPGADHRDDRELAHRLRLEADAQESGHRARAVSRRIHRRMDRGTLRRRTLVGVFVDLPAFHHEHHATHRSDVLRRIAVDGDDVSLKPGMIDPIFVLQLERLRIQ